MKQIPGIISAIVATIALISCSKEFEVSHLEIYPSEVTTTVNDTIQMQFSMVYEGGNFQDPDLIQVEWSTTDASIVEVSETGVIATKAIGTADVTVTCAGVSSTSHITVIEEEVPDDDSDESQGSTTDDVVTQN